MKYKSCNLLEHGICFYNTNLCSCCYAPQDGYRRAPYLIVPPLYNGQLIDVEYIFNKINFWKNNAKENKYLNSCKDCYKLEEKDWDDENYINQVYITHFEACNLNCIYCITGLKPEQRAKNTYKIVPVLDDLKAKGVLRQGCEFHIGGGEFTIYPECDEIIEKYVISGFSKHLAIATNGVKYSESVFKAMDIGRASIIISVDCGNEKLYKKIKGVNAFKTLSDNLKLYTRTEKSRENTFLKFIVIPKVNDKKREFINFLNFAKSFNIKGIKIDLDGNWCRAHFYKPDKKIMDFAKWAICEAQKQNFDVETFQFYNQCNSSI